MGQQRPNLQLAGSFCISLFTLSTLFKKRGRLSLMRQRRLKYWSHDNAIRAPRGREVHQ